LVFCFCSAGIWTTGLRQAVYHLSHSISPFCVGCWVFSR
jgi:hypothetical protein